MGRQSSASSKAPEFGRFSAGLRTIHLAATPSALSPCPPDSLEHDMTSIADAARRTGWKALIALPLVALTLSCGAAAEVPAEDAISDFTLANGMEVVVIPLHRAPVVTEMVWY